MYDEIDTYIGECEVCGFEKQHYGDFDSIICDRCGGSIKNKGGGILYTVEEGKVLVRVIKRGNSDEPVVRFSENELSIAEWKRLKKRVDALIKKI